MWKGVFVGCQKNMQFLKRLFVFFGRKTHFSEEYEHIE